MNYLLEAVLPWWRRSSVLIMERSTCGKVSFATCKCLLCAEQKARGQLCALLVVLRQNDCKHRFMGSAYVLRLNVRVRLTVCIAHAGA